MACNRVKQQLFYVSNIILSLQLTTLTWLVFSGQVMMLNDSFEFLIKILIVYIPMLLLLCLALAVKGQQFWTTKGLKNGHDFDKSSDFCQYYCSL